MSGAVYLTGVPGTGKSSVLSRLENSVAFDLKTFSYSEHLGRYLGRTRDELRAESSAVVVASAVAEVDLELAGFVADHRLDSLVVIDSHAVTDEAFGQRVIPFKPEVLAALSLDAIVCLTAGADTIALRVAANAAGRPVRTTSQIAQTQRLQEAVAVSYAAQLGVPLYVVDVDGEVEDVVATVEAVLVRATRA